MNKEGIEERRWDKGIQSHTAFGEEKESKHPIPTPEPKKRLENLKELDEKNISSHDSLACYLLFHYYQHLFEIYRFQPPLCL